MPKLLFDKIIFNEPLVEMTFVERFVARTITGVSFMVFTAVSAVMIGSPFPSAFWIGALMMLFVLDKLMHVRRPRRRLSSLDQGSKEINLADYVSPHARRALVLSHERAFLTKGNFMLHLAQILFEDNEVKEALRRLDINLEEFEDKLESYVENSDEIEKHEKVGKEIKEVMSIAVEIAINNNSDFIGCGDIFSALSRSEDSDIKRLFDIFNIKSGDVEKAMIFGTLSRLNRLSFPKTIGGFAVRHMRRRVINRAWTSRPTPVLDRFSVDYSSLARSGSIGLMIGHNEEYERLLSALSTPVRPNALLVGESGVGKDVVISHLAYMISKDKVTKELFDKRLVALDIGSLLSNADQAELQSRIKEIFEDIYQAGNIILVIPDVHNLAKTSPAGEVSVASTMIPMITSNDFPLIATTYPREYKQYIESDSAFNQAFDVIRVKELSEEEALRVLIYRSFLLEKEYKVRVTYSAIKASVQIAFKYFRSKPLPGSAMDLLKDALAYANRHGIETLGADEIISAAEARINVPIQKAGEAEAQKLLNLEDIIHKRLVDQEGAVKLVAESLREYRSGLSRKGGPIGTFLFVGPTGVGKTELSKILAEIQFGQEDAMIRFDMSEYQDKTSVFQFIGSPDGTMAGLLTDRVWEKPYSLILLDEFEKAHPDILNLFLQVFDDGRLTDNFGRVVSFENTIIIATSNAHSAFIKEELEKGRSMQEISVELKKKLANLFKPELINRFSGIAVFKDLSREDILKITKINIASLASSLTETHGITLEIEDKALEKIAELGFDPVFGARPLRQTISDKIKSPLSKMILRGSIARGGKVVVRLEGQDIKVS